MSYTCPKCGMTSHNPNDEREGYCGNCHDWTRGRAYLEAMTRPMVLTPEDEDKIATLLSDFPAPKAEDRVWGDGFIDQTLLGVPVCQHTARNPLANGDEFCLNCGIVL